MDSAQPLPRCTSASQPVHNSLRLIVSHTLIFYFPQELVKKSGFIREEATAPNELTLSSSVLLHVRFLRISPILLLPSWCFAWICLLCLSLSRLSVSQNLILPCLYNTFCSDSWRDKTPALALSMSPLYPFLFLYPNSHGYFCFTSREV